MHTVNNLSLRFLLRIIRVFVTLFFLIATAKAQNIDVVFAGNEEKILNEFGKEKIEDTYQKGIVGVKIDESNVKIFQKIAPRYIQLIYEQITSQSNLKKWMQKGMAISENSMNLTYILVDDTEGLEKDEESFFSVYESSVDKGKRYVWPSFGNELVDKKEDKYQGWIYIGEGSCKTMVEDLEMGEKSLSNLTLNQAIRAQFFGNPTSWPYIYKPRRGLLNMDYSPYRAEEPIYTLGTGIEEATGYFFNILYNKEERQQLGIFFRNNARKYAISEDNKLYKNGGWIPKGQNSFKFKGKHFYAFNWSELPADKMLHFPSTSLFLYTYFWKYAPDQDQALEMIIQTSNYMWKDFDKRNLIYATHHLAMQLENYAATTEGQSAKRRGELTSSMLPYALLDFLTHYGMSDQEITKLFETYKFEREGLAFTTYMGKYRIEFQKKLAPYLARHHKNREEGIIEIFTLLKRSEMIVESVAR